MMARPTPVVVVVSAVVFAVVLVLQYAVARLAGSPPPVFWRDGQRSEAPTAEARDRYVTFGIAFALVGAVLVGAGVVLFSL